MNTDKQRQKLADDARLLRAWRKWHREEREQALAGSHCAMIERLMFSRQPHPGIGALAARLHPLRRLGDG